MMLLVSLYHQNNMTSFTGCKHDHTNICCHDDVICTASISYFAVCVALFVIVWLETEDFG